MVELFPQVQGCCLIFDLRLGMLFIAIFSVMTGVLGMSICEQKTNANFKNLKNVTNINDVAKTLSGLKTIIPTGMALASIVYMFGGLLLLYGNLTDEEGLIQLFVWLVFLAVIAGYLLVILITVECFTQKACLLSDMDWLSGAVLLVVIVAFLTLWYYFLAVVNSYVSH